MTLNQSWSVGATEHFLRLRKFLFRFLLAMVILPCGSGGMRNTNTLSPVVGISIRALEVLDVPGNAHGLNRVSSTAEMTTESLSCSEAIIPVRTGLWEGCCVLGTAPFSLFSWTSTGITSCKASPCGLGNSFSSRYCLFSLNLRHSRGQRSCCLPQIGFLMHLQLNWQVKITLTL